MTMSLVPDSDHDRAMHCQGPWNMMLTRRQYWARPLYVYRTLDHGVTCYSDHDRAMHCQGPCYDATMCPACS